MDVQQLVNATATASKPTGTDRVGSSELGKDAFLKLMLAQLQNQDPTQPQDSKEFTAQLAQFTSVEQLQKANTNLTDILAAQSSNSQAVASSFVGREATFRSDILGLTAGNKVTSGAFLAGDATEITATIKDGERVVRTIKVGGHNAGAFDITWDGRRDDGTSATSGNYSVQVNAKDINGAPVPVEMRGRGVVEGVSFETGAPQLRIGSQKISMSQIVEINQRSIP